MRINAFLAQAGVVSRRKADELIKAGKVKVNDETAQLNTDVSPNDKVEVSGRIVEAQSYRYLILNKPKGYVTTLNDPEGRRKVTDLIGIEQRVVPVGRLDYNTTGLLILTNDGQLANKLMHPSSGTLKTYEVVIQETVTRELLNKLSNGVQLEDGMTSKAKAVKTGDFTLLLSIHEGRNRQIRRMVAACGIILKSLKRVSYGPLNLGDLRIGQWRDLSPAQIEQLKK